MTTITELLLGAVHVGDVLPELRYDVTATTVVLGALADPRHAARCTTITTSR